MIKINTSKLKYCAALTWCAIIFFAAFLLKDPAIASGAAKDALLTCYKTVIPSLFPYMVISSLTVSSGLALFIGKRTQKPFSRLFAINGGGAAAFVIGLIAGFPVGAKTAVALYREGICDKDEAQRLCAFCNNTGPAFVIAGVGSFLGDYSLGCALYLIEVISAVILGVILSANKNRSTEAKRRTVRFTPDLTAAIHDSVTATLTVCGFVVFFSVLVRCLFSLSENEYIKTAIAAVTEVTAGTSFAASLGGSGAFILCAFAVGWSGVCVHAQSAAFLIPEGLSIGKYILAKSLGALICTLLAVIYSLFFINV